MHVSNWLKTIRSSDEELGSPCKTHHQYWDVRGKSVSWITNDRAGCKLKPRITQQRHAAQLYPEVRGSSLVIVRNLIGLFHS